MEHPRLDKKTYSVWPSLNEVLNATPAYDWLNNKCQQYALTLSLSYTAEGDTFGEAVNFSVFDIAERIRNLDNDNCSYWYIVHDMDKYTDGDAPDKEQVGKLKPAHIHLVVDFHRELRAYSVLRKICRLFGSNPDMNENPAEYPDLPVFVAEDVQGVQMVRLNPWLNIKPVKNLTPTLAYLTHETPEAEKAGKMKYPHLSVISNDKDTFECAVQLVKQGQIVLTPANLISIVRQCNYSCSKVLLMLGVERYQLYRMIIRDLIQERV